MKQIITCILPFFLLCFFISLLSSCRQPEIIDELEQVLNQAGDNRPNLEKVLKHYSKKRKDSLKYQAACYLIITMPGHYGIYHHDVNTTEAIYENIERTIIEGKAPAIRENTNEIESPNNEYKQNDLEVITADFMINNIDNAFYVWEEFPWCKDLSFEDFKTYILPYRCNNEPLMNLRGYFIDHYKWLIDSMAGSNDMKKAYQFIEQNFYNKKNQEDSWEYGNMQNMYDAIRLNNGLCEHATTIKTYILRSLGVVCTYDHITHWANRNGNHSWNAYVRENNIPFIIDGRDSLYKHPYLHSAYFKLNAPGDKFLPDNLYVTYNKTAAKVFRNTFKSNNEFEVSSMPCLFSDEFIKDVSDDYLTCYDIKIKTFETESKELYLCVFSKGWIEPVFGAKISGNGATFSKMGSNVLYFPAVIINERLYPIMYPFILQDNGDMKEIHPDQYQKEVVTLYRKYPLFANILNYANRMYMGKFQGSNSNDFPDATDLFCIDSTYLLPTEISINNKSNFRYLRYLPDSATNGDIAELTFYKDSSGIDVPLRGKPVYKFEGTLKNKFNNAFDNNLNSYYSSYIIKTWIGLDLGVGNATGISKIRFCSRTDTNFIIQGNEYELFYWDNGWKSLGRKIAIDYKLTYYDVPEKALLWLHCHSGGTEERPFTYEEGRQLWW